MDRIDQLLTVQVLAEYLGVPVATIYAWRYRNQVLRDSGSAGTSASDSATSRNGSTSR
jgi:lambda repressor-like predicted transcriptional regulator